MESSSGTDNITLKLLTVESLKRIQEKLSATSKQINKNVDSDGESKEQTTTNQDESTSSSSSQSKAPNPDLVDGQPIPRNLLEQLDKNAGGEGESCSFGVPLEEIDGFYQNTYIVIGAQKCSKLPIISRFNAQISGHPLNPLSPIRRTATNILTHWIFAIILKIVICLNFFTLLLNPYIVHVPILNLFNEITFLIIYTIELFIKAIAKGCFNGPFTGSWNFWFWLDLSVVIFGITDIVCKHPFFHAFAGLRLLKIVPLTPDLRNYWNFLSTILNTLLKFILPLVFGLAAYFAVFAVQMYQGALTAKCILNYTATHDGDEGTPETIRYFYNSSSSWLREDWQLDSEAVLCSQLAPCPEGYVCLRGFGPNPDYNYTNFDSFSWSLLGILRLIILDFAEPVYQMITLVMSSYHIIFFLLIFFLISFPFLSFTIAIIAKYFHEYSNHEDEVKESDTRPTPASKSFSWTPSLSQICCNYKLFWNPSESTQKSTRTIVSRPIFEIIITTVLVLDVITLCLEHDGMSKGLANGMNLALAAYKLIYIIEFILKYMACGGFKSYFEIEGNKLAFVAIVGIILQALYVSFTAFGATPIHVGGLLYQWTFIRIFRLVYKWNSLRIIFKIIKSCLIHYRIVFTFIVMYFMIFAHIGTTLYGPAYQNAMIPGVSSNTQAQNSNKTILSSWNARWNFTNFMHSLMVIFRLVCGEWIETLWDCFTATAEDSHTSTKCYLFYLFAILIGNFLTLCGAIGVVLTTIKTLHHNKLNPRTKSPVEIICKSLCLPISDSDEDNSESGGGQRPNAIIHMGTYNIRKNRIIPNSFVDENPEESNIQKTPKADTDNIGLCLRCKNKIKSIRSTKLYHGISILLIVLVSLSYIPFSRNENYQKYYKYFQTRRILTIIFTIWLTCIEIPFKFIQFGCRRFFTNTGCVFDLIVGLAIILDGFFFEFGFGRAFFISILVFCRPLLLINRIKRLQRVARGLYHQIRLVKKYVLAGAFIWILFGLEGLWLLNGRYYKCSIPDHVSESYNPLIDSIRTEADCSHLRYITGKDFIWEKSEFNFDDIGESLQSLAFTSIFNGWINVVHDAIDSTGVHLQPTLLRNYIIMNIYMIIFVVFGVFFLGNIIIGVFVYTLEKDEDRLQFLSDNQKKSYNTKLDDLIKSISSSSPAKAKMIPEQGKIPEPTWKLNKFLYSIVTNMTFEKIVLGIILVDVFLKGCESFGQSPTDELIFTYANLIIVVIYVIEMILKILAWRRYYFTTGWNIFDFIVVILSVIGLLLSDLLEAYFMSPVIIRLLRLIRISRILFNDDGQTLSSSEGSKRKASYEQPSTPEKYFIKPLEQKFCHQIYNFVTNFKFDTFIIILILLDYFEIHFNLKYMSSVEIMFCFTLIPIIYYIELILKLIAWRQFYICSIWNILDFLAIIGISYRLGFILGYGWGGGANVWIDLLLVLERLRVLRLIRFIPIWQYGVWGRKEISSIFPKLNLQLLKRAIIFAWPTIFNLLGFFTLIIFSFAFFGIILFGSIKVDDNSGGLTPTTNFGNFGSSIITLIQLSTVSGVDGIYSGLATAVCSYEHDDVDTEIECGQPIYAKLFLIVYVGLTGLVFVNIYLALILETIHQLSFEETTDDNDEPQHQSPQARVENNLQIEPHQDNSLTRETTIEYKSVRTTTTTGDNVTVETKSEEIKVS